MTTDSALARLRAANPAQPGAAVDAHTLFARITALPREAQLRRPSRRRRPVLIAASAAVLVALLASAAVSGWFPDVIGPKEVKSEYVRAQSVLTLPPGYEWPALNFPANSVTSRGGGGAMAVMTAQSAWECYWVSARRHGDGAGEQRSRQALNELMAKHIVVAPDGASENWAPPQSANTPTAAYADDGGYQFKERMYAAAAAGHVEQLEQSCGVNARAGWGS